MRDVHIRVSKDVAEILRQALGTATYSDAVQQVLAPLEYLSLDALNEADFLRARVEMLRVMARILRRRAEELDREADSIEEELKGLEESEDVAKLFGHLNRIIADCDFDLECIKAKGRGIIAEIEEKLEMPRGWLEDQVDLVRRLGI